MTTTTTPTKDQLEKHFKERTNHHIDLVGKYLAEISDLNLPEVDTNILDLEATDHDSSKFLFPEYGPYLHLTWKYKLQKEGHSYPIAKELQSLIHKATFYHIKNNKHHPEYWDPNVTIEALNLVNRDKPSGNLVDATRMPLTYVASMVADWLAMSEEKSSNPYEWAEMNIDKRWKFTQSQKELIYKILELVWVKKK